MRQILSPSVHSEAHKLTASHFLPHFAVGAGIYTNICKRPGSTLPHAWQNWLPVTGFWLNGAGNLAFPTLNIEPYL